MITLAGVTYDLPGVRKSIFHRVKQITDRWGSNLDLEGVPVFIKHECRLITERYGVPAMSIMKNRAPQFRKLVGMIDDYVDKHGGTDELAAANDELRKMLHIGIDDVLQANGKAIEANDLRLEKLSNQLDQLKRKV